MSLILGSGAACSGGTSPGSVADAGGVLTDGGACPRNETPVQILLVCASPSGLTELDTDGMVITWRTGFEDCLGSLAEVREFRSLGASAHVLRFKSATGTEYTFGVVLQGVTTPIAAGGETIHLTYSRGMDSGGLSNAALRIDRPSGELMLYVGSGGRPESLLSLPGVTLALGQLKCPVEDAMTPACARWGYWGVSATVQETTMELAPGMMARVGNLNVAIGRSEQPLPVIATCPNPENSKTTVAITP